MEEVMPLIGSNEERWKGEMDGKKQIYICTCRKSMASVFGCHCSKKGEKESKTLFLNMPNVSPPCRIHDGTVISNQRVKLAGWV